MLAAVLPYLIGFGLIAGLWLTHKAQVALAHHSGYSEGTKEQRAKDVKEAEDALAKAEALWLAKVNESDAATKAEKDKRDATFTNLSTRAGAVRGAVCVPRAVDRLLADVTREANTPGPAAERAARADPVPGPAEAESVVTYNADEFSRYAVKAGEAYADARSQWKACVDTYDRLRTAK